MNDVAFVLARLDYGNATLAVFQGQLTAKLHATPQLILTSRKFDHVATLSRKNIHWLRFSQRIDFKFDGLVFR
jgi:hypothetical protein